MNATDPPAIALSSALVSGSLTIAVNVTSWPEKRLAVLGDLVRVVTVSLRIGGLIVRSTGLESLAANEASPPYAAVTTCSPVVSVPSVSVASSCPSTTASAAGVCVTPSTLKVTSPVGGACPDAPTIAVKVTG